MDIRQSPNWGKFLTQIGWKVETVGKSQAFIRPIPFLNCSVIKMQRPQNPIKYSEIDLLAKKFNALCCVIEPNQNCDIDLLQKHGFKKATSMSYLHTSTTTIDLNRSAKEILSSFSENARRNIKKALKNKLRVEKIFLKEDPNDLAFKKFFPLLSNITKMKKFFIPGYNEFYKKMLAFKDSSAIILAFDQNDPEPVAGVWMGYFGDTAVYMHAGNTQKGYTLLANYLLVWEALKIACNLKLNIFDFEGIFDPRFPNLRKNWQGFSQFKNRFHGAVVQYPPPYIKCYSRIFKLFYLCNKLISRS